MAPAQRSLQALRKVSTQRLEDGSMVHDLHSLLQHLASLTRNRMTVVTAPDAPFDMLSQTTPQQARALELLGLSPSSL